MDLRSSKKLAKSICELSHEVSIQSLSTLGIRIIETVVNGLRNYVVKFLKELLSSQFVKSRILNQSERHEVGRNSIQKKFLVLLKLRLWITDLANDVPESIGD